MDEINALFQLGCAYYAWSNALALYRSGSISGINPHSTVFFTIFGVWNMVFFSSIGAPLSFWAGVMTVLGNAAWVFQAVKILRRRP